jgi:hypothetical protein
MFCSVRYELVDETKLRYRDDFIIFQLFVIGDWLIADVVASEIENLCLE